MSYLLELKQNDILYYRQYHHIMISWNGEWIKCYWREYDKIKTIVYYPKITGIKIYDDKNNLIFRNH